MNEQKNQIEANVTVNEEVIQDQIGICNRKMREIIEDRIDVAEEDDMYRKIDGYLGNVESATLDCFTDRKQTSVLFVQLRYFLRGLIEERGYKEKLIYKDGEMNDNPIELCHWFKLYATVGLNEAVEIKNIIGFELFNDCREEIDHPMELPSPQESTDPELLSSIFLIWYAIEELIDLWGRLLDEDRLDTRLQLLRDDHEFQIGFVSKLFSNHGYVTSYQKGESGKSTRIEPKHVAYFPSEGDIVQFEAKQQYKAKGDPHPSFTPVIENFRVQQYP